MADRPPAERGDRRPLALASGRRQPGRLGQVGAHRDSGQLTGAGVVVGGEREQIIAVGADRVRRGVAVAKVGEELVEGRARGCTEPRFSRITSSTTRHPRSCLITRNRIPSAQPRPRAHDVAMEAGLPDNEGYRATKRAIQHTHTGQRHPLPPQPRLGCSSSAAAPSA